MTVNLRPVSINDSALLYDWFLDPSVAKSWRYRGATPHPEVFHSQLWSGVLAHFVCERPGSGAPIGYVSLYDANLSAQTAKVSCLIAPELRNGLNALDCVMAVLEFGFSQWPLRKVYFECNSVSIRQFQSAIDRGLMVEEARLIDFECFGAGEWADMVWLSTDRTTFDLYRVKREDHHSRRGG